MIKLKTMQLVEESSFRVERGIRWLPSGSAVECKIMGSALSLMLNAEIRSLPLQVLHLFNPQQCQIDVALPDGTRVIRAHAK